MKDQNKLISRAYNSKDVILKELWIKAKENKDSWKPIRKLVNKIKDRIFEISSL